MDDPEQYERFDVDNDFEGGEWIGGEFFYSRKRQKKQQTRDEALYGYDSGSDNEGRPRRGRKGGKPADYSKPVGFVSKGVVQSTEEKEEDVARSEQPSAAPGFDSGNGTFGPGGGLGFKPAREAQEEDEDDHSVLPTAFGRSIKKKAQERTTEQQQRTMAEKKRASNAADPSLGAFEQYTKGIGSKLLASMGFKQGEGLGRNKQGISKPVEVKMRPKGMGMGFNDYEEHKLAKEAQLDAAQPAPAKAEAEVVPKLWKKRNAAARVRRDFRTAEEVLREAAERPAIAPQQAILDMRGPQTRLVTNLEHLNVAEEGEGAVAVPMPELQHNLQLLVDVAESDIRRLDGKLRQEKDTAVLLGREAARLREEVGAAAAQVARAAAVLARVETAAGRAGRLGLGELQRTYAGLQAEFPEEYVLFDLARAALAQVLPVLVTALGDWDALGEPERGAAEVARWRPLLESPAQRDAVFHDVAADGYGRLLAAAVLPRLASAITNGWQPRYPEPALQWLETWAPLLPTETQRHILDNLIFPKLSRAVQEWEPMAETIPLHLWLHPWLPLLGPRLEDLYPTIRFKLATALQQWHPSDASALDLLKPWRSVFAGKEWDALLARSIVPKLGWALGEVDPMASSLDAWNWAMAWADVLDPNALPALLDTRFWPRWQAVLHHWLAHSPDYDEVTAWYLGWKGLLPAEVQDHERVRAQLTAALNAMNAATEGAPPQPQPAYTPPQPAPLPSGYVPFEGAAAPPGAYAEPTAPPAMGSAGAYAAPGATEPSLRQLVEQYAVESGVDFLPKAGRRHEGLQVYGFGGMSCVVDGVAGVLRAQLGGRWVPMSLESLLQHAHARQAR